MKRLFVVTPEAKNDLKEILLDIAEDSPETAERLRSDELLSRKYRFWNFYSYVVAYVWEAKPIQVISVVHGGRDLGVFFTLRVRGEDTP